MSHPSACCRSCGVLVTQEAPGGLCAACLLKIGWAEATQSALKIRCPHCQSPFEIVDGTALQEITCPSCDTHFSLADDPDETLVPGRPRTIGRFEIVAELGQGAFGTVWKARDPELDRFVAIKIPRRGAVSAAEAEKFLREARSAAQLRHPHIVSVHEVGREGDLLYIVSDLIDGATLADVFSARRLPPNEAAGLCEQIAGAVHHAHQAGIIHRDIKPSNILLDRSGATHITDFGLAKRDAAEITMTLDGQILGTPAYMSPEQARGDAHAADARSDVYSLGVVLFEMMTGEKPFRGTTRMVLNQVLDDTAPSPRGLNALIPRDLETICLKCLEKDPARRYDTAKALADDLHRYSEGGPIAARPVSRLEQQWRWCQRNPLPAALTGLLALTMILGMAGVVSQWRIAVWEQHRAEESTMQYRDELVRLTTANGHFAVELDAPRRALSWYARGLAQSEGNPVREEMNRRRIGTISLQIPRLDMVFGGEFPLVGARYSPDGGQVATWGSTQLQLVDADSGIATGEPLESPLQVNLVQYSPDGRHVAVLRQRDRDDPASQREVALLDSQTGRLRFAPVRVRGLLAGCAEFVDDGRTLAVVGQDSLVFLDCQTGNRRTTPLPMSYGMWLEATPDRRRVLVCCGYYEAECTIIVVDVVSGAIVGKPVEKVEVWTSGSHVSRDGRAFATWEYDPTGGRGSGPSFLQLWEVETGMPLFPPFPTEVDVDSVYFPQSRPIVIAHLQNQGLFAWNLRTGIETPLHSSVRDRCRRFVFSPDESRLALDRFAGDQSEVIVVDPWDVSQATIRFSQPGGSLLWSPDGQQLAVDGSTQMRLIDLPSREVRVIDSSGRRGDDVVQFSPNGRQLLTVTPGDVARVWDVSASRPELRILDGNANAPHSALALSPSGNLLAIGGGLSDATAYRNNLDRTGRFRVWDWREGKPLGPQVDLASRVQEIVFGADDHRAALVTESGAALVIDSTSGITQLEVGDSESPVAAVALSPSNQLIAYRSGVAPHEKGYAPSFDKRHARLEFWSLEQPPRLERTQELDSHVLFALSNDGRFHLLAGDDGAVRVFGTAGGARIDLAELPARAVGARFNRDGSRVVVVTQDHLAKVWNAQTGEVVASAWEDVEQAWFGIDDRFLVTLRESKCQVWDAATAEPVSLPVALRRDDSSSWNKNLAVVDAQGDHLLSLFGSNLAVWDLSPDSRPMETVAAEIQSAAGHFIDARGGYSPRSAADTVAAWKKCQAQSEGARSKDSREPIRWHEQSARLYEQALHTDRHHPPAQTQGYWYATAWHLERLVAADRRDPAIPYRLGQAQRELGRFVEAETSLSSALAANGTAAAGWWYARGQARAGLGRIDEAVADVAQAVETGFDEDLTEQPEWAKRGAIRGLDRLLKNSPANVDLLRRRAELHWNLNHWGPGLADFDALLVESPADKHPWLHHRRGDCLTGLGRFEDAIAAYSRALGPTEDDPTLLDSRAGARALLGRYDEAIADLERAKPLWSNPFEPTMNAALVHLLAGDQANYQRELSAAVEPMIGAYGERWTSHMPDEVAMKVTWLAALGPARQRTEKYLELAENVARRSPDNPRARLSLGAMRLACGYAAGSVETLTPVAESPTVSVTAAALLAICSSAQHDAIQANVWRERISTLLADEAGSVELPWPNAASKRILMRRSEEIPESADAR